MRIEAYLTQDINFQEVTVLVAGEASSEVDVVPVMEIVIQCEDAGNEDTHIHAKLGSIFHSVANNIMKTTGGPNKPPVFDVIRMKESENFVISDEATRINFYEERYGSLTKAWADREKAAQNPNLKDCYSVPLYLFDGKDFKLYDNKYIDRWNSIPKRVRTEEDENARAKK